MSTNAGRTALVTGASSGIGEALARCFAGGGFDLVLVARSAARLQALADELQAAHGVAVCVLPADLAALGAAAALHTTLKRRRLAVDVLVNNAGVLEHGAFTDIAAARHQQVIDLNIGALTAMLAQFVPDMRERGWGRVLNVASLAAFQPVPSLATYAATKAYVLSLSEALAVELDGSGVSVTALCPGFTDTPMIAVGAPGSGKLPPLPAMLVGQAADVAAEGYRACLRGEVVCVPGVLNRATSLATRLLPRRLVRGMGSALARPRP